MENIDHIESHDRFAKGYDAQVKEYNSYGHEALFGMCYEYITPGESLLDLGIGTGLSSVQFAQAGLEITGMDGSREMLNECKKKGFARELKQYDIQDTPLPYPDSSFTHIICCGVLHFFADLLPIFKETARLHKPGGIIAFSVASLEKKASQAGKVVPDFIKKPTVWGIPIYMHSDNYIQYISQSLGFHINKQQKILVESGDKDAGDFLFKIFVLK